MTEQEFERLSSLIDDELPPNEIGGEIQKLCQSDSAGACWSSYHLIGDAMRREMGPLYDPGLAQAISQRLQDEPVVLAPGSFKRPGSSRRKTLTGLAVAASLTAMAVVLTPQLISPEGTQSQPAMAQQPQPISPQGAQPQLAVAQPPQAENKTYFVTQDGSRWELLKKPAVESRLNAYLVNHQERSPSINIKGIIPYTSFVSYDGNKQ